MAAVAFANPITANYTSGDTSTNAIGESVIVDGVGDGRHWIRAFGNITASNVLQQIGDVHRPAVPIVIANTAIVTGHDLVTYPTGAKIKMSFKDNIADLRPWDEAWIDVQQFVDHPLQEAFVWNFGNAWLTLKVTNVATGEITMAFTNRAAIYVESSVWAVL